MRRATTGIHQPAKTGRVPWASSRGRLVYNVILSGIAAICGLILVVAPGVFGATGDSRMLGGMLAGYGMVRGYYFYRRRQAHAASQPAADSPSGDPSGQG